MDTKRTTSMTVIGVISIVFGSLGLVGGVFTTLAGGAIAALGSAGTASGAQEAGQVTGLGLGAVVIGVVGIIAAVALLVGGIGILKVRPWARTLCLGYAGLSVATKAAALFLLGTGGIGLVIGLIYPGVLLYFFFANEKWKRAFSTSPLSHGFGSDESLDHRAAA